MLKARFLSTNDTTIRKQGYGKLTAYILLSIFALFQVVHNALPTTRSMTFGESVYQRQQEEKIANVKKILETRRQNIEKICNHDENSTDRPALNRQLEVELSGMFTPPATIPHLSKKDPVQPCRYTFIDFGANIGDSLGKFMEAPFPVQCFGTNTVPRYSLVNGNISMEARWGNDLVNVAKSCFKALSIGPEDFCYVGIEGNPVFTPRLERLEAMVMATTPRPIRAAHFYTESVGTGVDGPTFLHLDTVNSHVNFWGSSIFDTHPDVQRSAVDNATVKAPVMGLTLSTVMKRSVQRVKGALALVKMDIEGGEYPLMNEAIETLCDFTSAGVHVNLIIEMHPSSNLGGEVPDYVKFFSHTQKRINECNISQGYLSPAGGQ